MITFIVCTKNSENTIYNCINSIKEYPVILVDKESIDNTIKIAKQFKNIKIIKQKCNGLANARNEGLKHVNTKYVCMWGSDNMLGIDNIELAIERLEFNNWVGIGYRTKLYKVNNYIDYCFNFWWRNKIIPGDSKVVGTPVIHKTDILKRFGYNEECTHSDDTDLGERLYYAGYKQGYFSSFCYDISKNKFSDIIDRFMRYGKSDFEFYEMNKKSWSVNRKIKSLLHPLKTEWCGFNLYFIPFYFMIVFIRYFGWAKNYKRNI